MRSARLRRRRARAQPAIRLALAGVVLVSSGAAAGVAGYLAAATDAGTRTTLADASADAPLAFEVSSTGGEPEQVDAALSEQLAGIDVPHVVYRSQISGSRVAFPGPDGPPPTVEDGPDEDDEHSGVGHLVLAAYQELTEHAELVAGEWPAKAQGVAAHPVAVHAAPAAELGIAVGDVISFSDRGDAVVLDVVGLWRPLDADSPFWFEAREADGAAGHTDLVGVMSEAGLAAVPGLTLTSRWRIVPDLDRMLARDVGTLRAALPRIRPALERDDRTSGARVETDSGILNVLSDSESKRRAVQGLTAAPLLLLAVAGVLAVALVGRLLAVARRAETSILRARGASLAQVFLWSLTEALPVVVLPSIAGATGAWLVLSLAGISAVPAMVATAAGLAAAVCAVTLVAVGTRTALGPASSVPEWSADGRRGRLSHVTTAIVAVAIAVVTMWQLLKYGGPAVDDARGGRSINPLAAIAPMAALVAAGLLVTAGVALVARLAQVLVARRRTLGGVLAVRSAARRSATYSVPITLVVLAAGSGTLAAGLSGTWGDLQRDAAAHRAGADLQVVLAPRPVTAGTPPAGAALEPYRQIDGADSVTPVLAGSVQLGGEPVQLAAFPGGRPDFEGAQLAPTADSVEMVFAATMTARELDFGVVGEPGGEPAPSQVRVHLLLADADGLISAIRAGELAIPTSRAPTRHVVRADLPAGTAPWTLVGFDLAFAADGGTGQPRWVNDYAITLSQVTSLSGEIAHAARRPATWSFGFIGDPPRLTGEGFSVEQIDSRPGVIVSSGGFPYPSFNLRVLAGQSTIGADAAAPVAVQATEAALERSGLAVGDKAAARIAGADLHIEVVGTEADTIGMTSDEVLVADLNEITTAALVSAGSIPRPNQVWIHAANPDAASALAHGARPVAGPRAEMIDRVALEADLRANAFARMSLVTYWVVTGALLLLAGIGLAAAGTVLAGERTAEVEILRALGASPKVQAKVGRREQLAVLVLGLLLGAIAGGLVTVLVAGLLAVAATPIQLHGVVPVLRLLILPWTAVLGVLAVLAVAAAVSYGERLRRRANEPPARRVGT